MSLEPVVYIIDDEVDVRTSLATVVADMGLAAESCDSAKSFLERYDPTRVACLLVDLRMPEVDGLELLTEIEHRKWRVAAIMMSGQSDIPAVVEAMKAGAIDFLEKPYSLENLRRSIRRAIDLDVCWRAEEERRSDISRRLETLTPMERQVLELTAEGKPDKAIAARLDLSTRTIQLRRASLMKKVQARSRAELIRLAPYLSVPGMTSTLVDPVARS